MDASLFPPFDFYHFLTFPWVNNHWKDSVWILTMGFLVISTCGLLGNFLILRRMAFMGDAISHTILPGIVIAFLITQSKGTWSLFIGAIIAGVLTSLIVEFIHKRSEIKSDSAIGVTLSTLFAVGVLLVTRYTGQIDLDQDCVLYGELAFIAYEPPLILGGHWIGPWTVFRMGGVLLLGLGFVMLFYKELLVTSFDAPLARSLGLKPRVFHYALMILVSLAIVSGFEAVGAILVIAMLIFPGASASLIAKRLPAIIVLSFVFAFLSALIGLHIAFWMNCSIAGAMVVAGTMIFAVVYIWQQFQRI